MHPIRHPGHETADEKMVAFDVRGLKWQRRLGGDPGGGSDENQIKAELK